MIRAFKDMKSMNGQQWCYVLLRHKSVRRRPGLLIHVHRFRIQSMEWIWYWTIPMKNLDWNRNSDIVKLLEDNKKVFTEVSIFLLPEKERSGCL